MNDVQALQIGTVVPGSFYKVEKILGQGNFGITYLVRNTALGDVYAMKEFFPQEISNRDSSLSLFLEIPANKTEQFEILKRKFISEAKALKACNHEGIVAIKDITPLENTIYYLMEYVEGETLQKKYQGKPLKTEDAVELLKKIAEPLVYLHENKIAHCDLSPNNVMIQRDGSVKLIDFGFAKMYDLKGKPLSMSPVGRGTPRYNAPELIGGDIKEFTPSPDIYALGGIFYFLLTGHAPAFCMDIAMDEELLTKDIPSDYHEFIKKSMAIKLKDRFGDVEQLCDALFRTSKSLNEYSVIPYPDKNDGWKWKLYDLNTKRFVSKGFDFISYLNEEIFEVSLGGKTNLMDKRGCLLLAQWLSHEIWDVGSNKVVMVPKWIRNGKMNLMDINGCMLSDEGFNQVGDYCEGFARVENSGKYNYINEEGKLLCSVWLEYGDAFSDGFAFVKNNGICNFIDKSGNFLLNPQYEAVNGFLNGYAIIKSSKANNKYNYIDTAGNIVFDSWFDGAKSVARIKTGDETVSLFPIKENGYWNCALKDGAKALEKGGIYIRSSETGLCMLTSDKWHQIIVSDDKFVLSRSYDEVDPEWADDGKIIAKVTLNGEENLINTDGHLVSSKWYDDIIYTDIDQYQIFKNCKTNLISSQGVIRYNEWFDNLDCLLEGGYIAEKSGRFYILDGMGNYMGNRNGYLFAKDKSNGWVYVESDCEVGYLNLRGHYVKIKDKCPSDDDSLDLDKILM